MLFSLPDDNCKVKRYLGAEVSHDCLRYHILDLLDGLWSCSKYDTTVCLQPPCFRRKEEADSIVSYFEHCKVLEDLASTL